MNNLQTAILKTLSYFAVFNFPISETELAKYLIGYQLHKEGELTETLRELIKMGKVAKSDQGYFLATVEPSVDRVTRAELSKKKIEEAFIIFKPLFFWPYLQGIFVTGSVAAQNATLKNDTDVLIVTSPGTLWLTRMVVVIYLKLIGKYRTTICPNIWLTTESLAWEDRNIYSAFNLVMTIPILNRNYIYERFLNKNSWAKNFLPKSFIISEPVWKDKTKKTNVVVKFLDRLAYDLQRKIMATKMTSEEVTLNKAHFKKNDNRQKILDAYQTNLHIHAAHPTHS